MKYIFVYGSLRRGHYNHTRIGLDNAVFVKETRTQPNYTLVDLGAYPALLAVGNTSVVGEIYHVDDELFERIDRMEKGAGYYASVIALDDFGGTTGWLMAPRLGREIGVVVKSGDWNKK